MISYEPDDTVSIDFTTHADTGELVAPSIPFEVADFRIYKDGSASQKTTTNGITVTSPFDSIAGKHLVTIDTSVDTGDVGFWEDGSKYRVELHTATTVDAKDPTGLVVGRFELATASGGGLDAAGVRDAIGMAAADLDDQLDAILAGHGAGARNVIATVSDDALAVVAGSVVNVRTSGGVDTGIRGTTNSLGVVNFQLDDGNYLFAVSDRSGYQTHTPEAVSVDEDNEVVSLSVVVDTGVPMGVGWIG